jgi:hypothetical protein
MKLNWLEDVLVNAMVKLDPADKAHKEFFEAVGEIEEIKKYVNGDWPYHCYFILDHDLLDLANTGLYDVYGRMARRAHISKREQSVDREEFAAAARLEAGFAFWTIGMLECAMRFIHDLWIDNEQYKNNNPDGTFKA